jgi:hypothetical protein
MKTRVKRFTEAECVIDVSCEGAGALCNFIHMSRKGSSSHSVQEGADPCVMYHICM